METLLHSFISFAFPVISIPTWISSFCTAKTVYFHSAEIFKWPSNSWITWEVIFEVLLLWVNTQEKKNIPNLEKFQNLLVDLLIYQYANTMLLEVDN